MNDGNRRSTTHRWRKAGQISKAVLVAGILLFSILALFSFQATRAFQAVSPSSVDTTVVPIPDFACDTDSLVLAEYQAWHGSPNHMQPHPRTSQPIPP